LKEAIMTMKNIPEHPIRTVGIVIFDDVEVLDFCGPFEVFSVARPVGESGDERRLFQAVIIAEEMRTIRCRGGLLIQPHTTTVDCPPLDLLVIPGGMGTRRERHNRQLIEWIATQNERTELTTSVCTGAFLLAESGLLDGRRATTHWASVEWMRETYPAITLLADARLVDEGHIITSAGISAGIDMSLHVVARLHGNEVAAWTARRMEYDWKP
jgi:transcriptional regulator GlxA family with amidase domain